MKKDSEEIKKYLEDKEIYFLLNFAGLIKGSYKNHK